ncbi:MAG TPA: mechanosensitive ion channel domain-containing protein [Desulfomonilaceae bacterium]|nr:mechanosensitive ion channel domain-containing protein [Desulfomonilaceae bacterium]
MTFIVLLWQFGTAFGETPSLHPLAPPDKSSPRATIKTFLDSMNKAVDAYKSGNRNEARLLVMPAVGCLDLKKEPPALRFNIGLDSVLYLKEVLDRIELPADEDIPDATTVQKDRISRWTIPYTEITLAADKDGSPRTFLFTNDTVRKLEGFYNKVKHLPYVPGTGGGALYHEISSSAGMIVPQGFIKKLPDWTRKEIFGQAVWQWVGLFLYCLIGTAIIVFTRRCVSIALCFVDSRRSLNLNYYVGGLVLPVALIVFAGMGFRVTVSGLHIINASTYLPIAYVLTSLSYLGTVWLISAVLNRISGLIIAWGGFVRGDLDVQLIRLGFEILTVIFIIFATIDLGSRLGLPTYSLVTGLGIGGIAVALAGREALSNLIGTAMIILDRPFKLGDFIILGDGERGVVAEVGFRSTRIRTRDDILISVPNSVVANTKMINESAPISLFRIRIKVGVAYGSDLTQVERVLLRIAAQNEAVVPDPAPRVRFRNFGDSALDLELLCWIDPPELKGKITHELLWAIYEEFKNEKIEIPFPQRDVHFRQGG